MKGNGLATGVSAMRQADTVKYNIVTAVHLAESQISLN